MYGQGQRMPMPSIPNRPNIPPSSYPQNTQAPTSFGGGRSSTNDIDSAMNSINCTLRTLSSEELGAILEDETRQNKIIQDTEQIKQLLNKKQSLASSNTQLADENLRFEPQMQTAKTKLFESYHELPRVQEQYQADKQHIETLSSQFSPDTTLALIKTAAQQAEEEAEGIVDKFLDGDMAIDEFVETFRKQKMAHHLRKTKAEKLEEILRKNHPQYFNSHF